MEIFQNGTGKYDIFPKMRLRLQTGRCKNVFSNLVITFFHTS